jgi:hypothetical protein
MFTTNLFTTKLGGFCESLIFGGPPEYINSITSLIMTIVGFFGIYNNKHSCQNMYMMFSAMFFNGFASFLYHATAFYGWGIFDAVTMILIAVYGVNSALENIIYLYKFNHQNIMFNLVPCIYFTFMIVSPAVNYDELFRILFAGFLIFILIILLLIHNKLEHIKGLDHRLLHDAYKGVGHIALAGFCWIGTEIYCNSFWFVRYIPGHPVWHLFVSYGGYQVAQLLTALHILRNNNGFHYDNFKTVIHTYLPALTEHKFKPNLLRQRVSVCYSKV